jgi:hypothetical protein
MNCLNAGFASLDQCARVAIVAHHHRNPPRYPPSGERIDTDGGLILSFVTPDP